MKMDVFDETGQPVVGEKGELVCTRSFPSMPLGFWGDDSGEKYFNAYYADYPNIWRHGDWVQWTETGGMVFFGRSDATLNSGGVRIGTAEIYRQVEQLEEIQEAIVVGQDWDNDTRVVLFVVLRAGHDLTEELERKIRACIRAGASPRHVPARIAAVPDIPRTKSARSSNWRCAMSCTAARSRTGRRSPIPMPWSISATARNWRPDERTAPAPFRPAGPGRASGPHPLRCRRRSGRGDGRPRVRRAAPARRGPYRNRHPGAGAEHGRPVIQRAHARAAAAGAGSLDALTQAARLRGRDPDVPLILMGYAAELRSAGPAPYMDAMANAGADGLLIVDAEPAERIPWSQLARDRGIAFIQIVASDAEAESPPGPAWARSGFVYCVASDGPTGGTPPAVAALAARAGKARRVTGLPVVAGFGVRTPAMATAVGGFADAVAIGTVVVDALEKSLASGQSGRAVATAVGNVVHDLAEGLANARLTIR